MKKLPLLSFFLLSFAITWGLAALFLIIPNTLTKIFGPISLSNPIFILAVWAPTISGFTVTAWISGRPGVIALLKRFSPGLASPIWYLLVILVVPLAGIAVNLITGTAIGLTTISLSSLMAFLFINLITGPLGEEFGWRGFALPRLLERFSPFVASLVLGIIWAFWHLLAFIISGALQQGIQLPFLFLGALSMSFIITWVFLHVRQSIFFSFLFHYVVNFTLNEILIPFWQMSLLLAAIAAIVLAVFGWDLGKAKIMRTRPIAST